MGAEVNKKDATRLETIEDLFIFSRTGTVSGATTWSETHVSGGGGGGYMHNGSGHVSSTSISSTVRERQRFFLVEPDGDETEFNDTGLAVRDGQTVTVVYCGHKADQVGWPTAYYNHPTRAQSTAVGHVKWLTGKGGGGAAVRVIVAVVAGFVAQFIAALVLGAVGGSTLGILSWLVLPVAAWWVWKRMGKASGKVPEVDLKAAVQAEIERAKSAVRDAREPVAVAG